jgi:hypothetical protein
LARISLSESFQLIDIPSLNESVRALMTNQKIAPWGTVESRFDAIHSAARMRDVQAVRHELAAGVDVDVVNSRAENGDGGNTAL